MTRRSHSVFRSALAILTLTAAGWGTAVMAQPGGGMQGGMHGISRMLEQVEATPEQRAQIEQITAAARADRAGEREAAQALRAQSLQLLAQPTVDAAALESLRQQMLAQHDRNSQRQMQLMLDVSQVLTPEQRQQWAEALQQRRDAMQRKHGRKQGDKQGHMGHHAMPGNA